ncbi:hypothetical protein EV586_106152 [Tumebacillus sp. BK434]|uniref:hypothetical protein n=1 Tax=Tumebacillus sp. BK434 TaxID=2512169 RepID=UPI0010485762|nr:hypothetical protein [Tumebacillus sp. BK434]TCP53403.1 hypothetical protein EV586_106152 [Tumebacillus sp. BK434]
MIQELARFASVIVVSIWGSVYIGSLTLPFWRQRNYRGAIGIAILAFITLLLPPLITLYAYQ